MNAAPEDKVKAGSVEHLIQRFGRLAFELTDTERSCCLNGLLIPLPSLQGRAADAFRCVAFLHIS